MEPPLEHVEACILHNWLDVKKIDHWHLIQENVVKNPAYWQKLKDEGWRKGASDYIIFLPPERTKTKKGVCILLELKRRRKQQKNGKLGASPSKVLPEQVAFLKKLCSVEGIHGGIGYGADECIKFIETFLL